MNHLCIFSNMEVYDMKYSLIKYWRRHVNDVKCSLKDSNCRPIVDLWDIRILVDLQWKLIVFLRGLHFPSMRLLHEITFKTGISLKDLDYRVTSTWGCAHKFWILVGDMYFDFEIKTRNYLYIIWALAHISQNDTTWRI